MLLHAVAVTVVRLIMFKTVKNIRINLKNYENKKRKQINLPNFKWIR